MATRKTSLPRFQVPVITALLAAILFWAGTAAAAEPLAYGQGVLWRVEKLQTAPSHVFGTIHSTDSRITKLPAPVKSALAGSRSLTIEVVKTKDMPVRAARMMMLPPGRSLDRIIGMPLFGKLSAIATGFGLQETTLRRLKPWAAGVAISMPADERAGQAAGRKALDYVLQQMVADRGLPVHGLETIEEQLGIMDGLTPGDQVALLKQAIDDSAEISKFVETIKRYYLARDLGGMFAWMKRQTAGTDPQLVRLFEERMINARNRTMATRMAPLLDSGGAFVAIGAAHLPGKDGVLSLLARNGFKLVRVY